MRIELEKHEEEDFSFFFFNCQSRLNFSRKKYYGHSIYIYIYKIVGKIDVSRNLFIFTNGGRLYRKAT